MSAAGTVGTIGPTDAAGAAHTAHRLPDAAAAAAPALSVRRLSAWFGAAQALFDVDLDLQAGQIVALIGRNGAGKSTLFKALMGMVRASGAIRLAGRSIETLPPHLRARRGLGFVPEERRIFTGLTVRENLIVGRRARLAHDELQPLLQLFPNLAGMLDRPAAQMSGGEQQMLAVARTLAARPCVMLLDEPSEGIAPMIAAALARAVRATAAQGTAILLSEQNLGFVAEVADRALLIEHGQITGTATAQDLREPSLDVRGVLGF